MWLGDLTSLTELRLDSNYFQGTVPSTLAQLTALKVCRSFSHLLIHPLCNSPLSYSKSDMNYFPAFLSAGSESERELLGGSLPRERYRLHRRQPGEPFRVGGVGVSHQSTYPAGRAYSASHRVFSTLPATHEEPHSSSWLLPNSHPQTWHLQCPIQGATFLRTLRSADPSPRHAHPAALTTPDGHDRGDANHRTALGESRHRHPANEDQASCGGRGGQCDGDPSIGHCRHFCHIHYTHFFPFLRSCLACPQQSCRC